MKRNYHEHVLRDPIYGDITVPYEVISRLIDTPELQRLRSIRQMGMCHAVFHGAENTRFQHAVGVMWLMHRILTHWSERHIISLSKNDRMAAVAAALLHDIGHGPFSHALENVFALEDHETIGQQIVEHRLAPILMEYDIDPQKVLQILRGTYPQPLLHELLSSQLDVDRMDYLRRDSLYTGTKYGLYDIDRIIQAIRPMTDRISHKQMCAISTKGVEAVEAYLFGRYFMHWQVYLHKTVRSMEVLLRVVLRRARYVYHSDPGSLYMPENIAFLFQDHSLNFHPSLKASLISEDPVAHHSATAQEKAAELEVQAERRSPEAISRFLEQFVGIDDYDFYHTIKLWVHAQDKVLADLATRFIHRLPLKAIDHPGVGPMLDRIKRVNGDLYGDNADWYLHSDTPKNQGYDLYEPGSTSTPIRVLTDPPSGWKEFSTATKTGAVSALSERIERPLLMLTPECYAKIKRKLDSSRPYQYYLVDENQQPL